MTEPANDPRFTTDADGSVHPNPGYEWCPYCNGMGTVAVMDSGPHCDETEHECGFCDDGISEARPRD